jgi:hypothetical protein
MILSGDEKGPLGIPERTSGWVDKPWPSTMTETVKVFSASGVRRSKPGFRQQRCRHGDVVDRSAITVGQVIMHEIQLPECDTLGFHQGRSRGTNTAHPE